jgi:hypothetical protein
LDLGRHSVVFIGGVFGLGHGFLDFDVDLVDLLLEGRCG